MPNGTSAPGNVLPPPVVQVRVSTSCARLEDCTGALTFAWLRAPAGICDAARGLGQFPSRPDAVLTQTPNPVVGPLCMLGLGRWVVVAATPGATATTKAVISATTVDAASARSQRFRQGECLLITGASLWSGRPRHPEAL